MALSPRIEARTQQRLSITRQLRQAIELLRFDAVQLAEFLEEQARDNPLVEIVRPSIGRASEGASGISYLDAEIEGPAAGLHESLATQLALQRLPERLRHILPAMIAELDERGYFPIRIDEFADGRDCSEQEVADALAVLQECDPAGIGARNLEECLLLQCSRLGAAGEDMRALLPFIADLGRKDHSRILKLGWEAERLQTAINNIKRLDPAPARQFGQLNYQAIVPDIRVGFGVEGEIEIELLTDHLPSVLVNHEYAAQVSQDGSTRKYVLSCLKHAEWLTRAMETRAENLLKVAAAVMSRQHAFLKLGPIALEPLRRKDIAEELGLHESTISRIVAIKYVDGPMGVLPLSAFFSNAILVEKGASSVSSASIRARIAALIKEENSENPFTDERIEKMLRENGVNIARRTIAKYREAMDIPPSHRRKVKHPARR